ncbi:uncharacterized protein LOC134823076 [Bolinopsis microptera]|uniref:uncharacterized protein LOC134823076 n=1 Tax=Bolinopsis microptera TaxID=2820187 RepID=UPI00307AD346
MISERQSRQCQKPKGILLTMKFPRSLRLPLLLLLLAEIVMVACEQPGSTARKREVTEITPLKVTQGKTADNNEECCAAAHSVDMDFSSNSVTDTDNGAGWLKLEFSKTHFIHKIIIYYLFYTNWYNPGDWCVSSEDYFRTCVNGHNNVDVSVYQGEVKQKSCGTLQLTYGLDQSDQIYTLLCNTEGDTVKLSKSTGQIAVTELAVTSTVRKAGVTEIIPSKVTHGKTLNNNEESFAAAHAVDKDLSTQTVTDTDNGAGWLKLEFSKTHFIHKIIIYYLFYTNWYNPGEWCVQNEDNFRACVNGHNNVDVSVYQGEVKQKSCGTLQLTYGLDQSDQIYTLLCNTEGDTVKLSKSTGQIAVTELAVTSTVRKAGVTEIIPSKVTHGKTLNNNEESFAAAHAVDKDLSTQTVTDTDNGAGWLKLEFSKTHFIHKIIIYYLFYTNWYNPGEWCVQNEDNFRACVNGHNNVDVSVYQGEVKQKSCGTLQLTYGLDQSDQIYTLLCNTEGDTVKLSKSTGQIAVTELAVTSTVRKAGVTEIIPSKVTHGKTLNNNEEIYAAAHAVDKDLSTQTATTTDNGAGWLKLEFSKTHFIHKIIIYYLFYTNWYNPGEWCVQNEDNFRACVNGHNNVDVSVYQGEVKQKSCGTLQLTYGLDQSDQIYTLLCNTEGDTVKLSKSTGQIVVTELAVTSTVRKAGVTEIIPSKVTHGKTLENNEEIYAAAHAVDMDFSSYSVTDTDNGAGWLKLEFSKTHFIHKIVIYYLFYTNWFDPGNWCVQNEDNFRACVDIHNNVDVSVYQGEVKQKSCGTLQLTYGLDQSDQIYTLLCNTEGDTVKLSKSTGHIAVFDVAVTSTDSRG